MTLNRYPNARRTSTLGTALFAALLPICSFACGSDGTSAESGPPASAFKQPPKHLSEWHLFSDAAKQEPGPRTIPYEVISPLFSDYATKHRFLYVPEGKTIGYEADDVWKLPEGSV